MIPHRHPDHCRSPQSLAGFTVIELMVVVAILAIVAVIAAPSFRSMIGTMNAKSVAFDLVSDLTMARSEAIKRNQNISVVPVSESWAKGWVISDGTNILSSRAAVKFSLNVDAPVAGVVFLPNGRLSDEQFANKVWLINSSISGVTPRCVIITPTGSARSKSGGCS